MAWPADNLLRWVAAQKLERFLRQAEQYLGERPRRVTLYAEDYDLLEARGAGDVKLIRGNPRPNRGTPVHR